VQKRLVSGAVDRLCQDLRWAGLQWDEGPEVGGPHGPYQQSDRNEIYQQHVASLLDNGTAYRCFCTPQTAAAGSAAFVTSGCFQDCSGLDNTEASERAESGEHRFTVRLKAPDHVHKRVYPDLIYGKIQRLKRSPAASAASEEDSGLSAADTVLMKSDGTPTYHFANVVDDHLMEITHVIRGTEWMASTPLHYDLYTAFGWQPPMFAHVGLLLDKDKAKLSKRNADLALYVQGLRVDHGVLPETLCNFLALQGWSNPTTNDVMSMDDLVKNFDLKFTKGNTMVLMEKLWFLQKQHVQQRCERLRNGEKRALDGLLELVVTEAHKQFPDFASARGQEGLSAYCKNVLLADDKSYQSASQYVERNWYFFSDVQAVRDRMPPLQDSYSELPRTEVESLIHNVLNTITPEQAYRVPPEQHQAEAASGSQADLHARPRTEIERVSASVHAYINYAVWERVAPLPAGGDPAAYTAAIPFTDQPVNTAGVAQALADIVSEDAGVLTERYKQWQKAVMMLLRQKLAAGVPGPGIGALMAVLGYDECCGRMDVASGKGEGGGW
jgi:glutamyl-tRNA synthetase